jgi:hypothetical protein
MTTWLVVFTGIITVGFVLQSLAVFGLFRSVKKLSIRFEVLSADLVKTVESITGDVSQTLVTIKKVAEGIHALQEKLNATTDVVQKRIGELDVFLGEVTATARLEIARIQDAVDAAFRQVEDTFDLLNRSVITPVREVAAIVGGVRAAFEFLVRRPKTPSGIAPHDEEMFIG